jgi:non-specific serine/threonine protein kinase
MQSLAEPTTRLRSRIPPAATPLVGRERELAAITQRLHEDSRLLTLTGPGGCGKTRLALEVAAHADRESLAQVMFIDLTPVPEALLVTPTIAAYLGVREIPNEPLIGAIQRTLHADDWVLVLDNFEHVLAAATVVADLLAGCPTLKIVATSREPLRLLWEREMPIAPLSLPDPGQSASVDGVVGSPAVALFLARAQAARPNFELTEENAAAIVALCSALDGLPLAIELAASWIRVLDPASLLAHLADRQGRLEARTRDAPPRHRTMWSAIAWSYDRLSAQEQAFCRRLAVFAGGCTLAAAQVVADLPEALDILSSLIEKSLILLAAQPGEPPRYRMLETVRAFALEQLAQHGELAEAQARHAAFFMNWLEALENDLFANRDLVAYIEVGREHDNLRAALRWCLDADAAETGLRLGAVVWMYWFGRSQFGEGRRWLEALLALPSAGAPTHARARVLAGLAALALRQVDMGTLQAAAAEALSIGQRLADARLTAQALTHLGQAAVGRGDAQGGAKLLAEACAVAAAAGEGFWEGTSLAELGRLAAANGDLDQAATQLEESRRRLAQIGHHWGLALSLLSLGVLKYHQRQWLAAERDAREALALFEALGDRGGVLGCLEVLAMVALGQKQLSATARLLGTIARQRELTGFQPWGATDAELAMAVQTVRGALDSSSLEQAWALGAATSVRETLEATMAVQPGPGRPADAGVEQLTPREREVVSLIAQGRTSREIAELLVISDKTADVHADHVRAKLGLRSRAEIAAWAVAHGLVASSRFSSR